MQSSLAILLYCIAMSTEPHWSVQPSGTTAQFRGISVVSDTVAWLAGSMGTFGRTVDGTHWSCSQIPGSEKLMFRSVAGFDADHAVLLAIGQGDQSRILATSDGGKSWSVRWANKDPRAFYDSIAFWDRRHGLAFSDPVDGRFPLLSTNDGGLSWKPVAVTSMPEALKGEGAFSASGTCVVVSGASDVWIGTGGADVTRVFHSGDRGRTWTVASTPIPAGKETSGIFGLRFKTASQGIAVGGDYKDPKSGTGQIAFTSDGGANWRRSEAFPEGLREAAAWVEDQIMLVGPAGSDLSKDGGTTWHPISGAPEGLHTCDFHGSTGWAAGDHGLIVKWTRASNK